MADVLSFRLKQRPVRMAAATIDADGVRCSTCWRRWRAPAVWSPCCSTSRATVGQAIVIAVVGVLMIVYVLVGGMKGTTWVQIIKAVLLIGGAALMTVMVLAKFGLNFSEMLGSAQSAVSGADHRGRRQARRARPGRAVRRAR